MLITIIIQQNSFWSSTDDADEVKRNLLYGVFSFNHGINGEEMSLFRCCNGSNDRIINLSKEQLFESAPFEYDSKFVRSVMNSGKIVTI